MNMTSFLIYCFIVTFTPRPTNIVILSTAHNYRLQQKILNLSGAILSGKDESLCSELLLTFADSFTDPDLFKSYRKDTVLTIKIIFYHSHPDNISLY